MTGGQGGVGALEERRAGLVPAGDIDHDVLGRVLVPLHDRGATEGVGVVGLANLFADPLHPPREEERKDGGFTWYVSGGAQRYLVKAPTYKFEFPLEILKQPAIILYRALVGNLPQIESPFLELGRVRVRLPGAPLLARGTRLSPLSRAQVLGVVGRGRQPTGEMLLDSALDAGQSLLEVHGGLGIGSGFGFRVSLSFSAATPTALRVVTHAFFCDEAARFRLARVGLILYTHWTAEFRQCLHPDTRPSHLILSEESAELSTARRWATGTHLSATALVAGPEARVLGLGGCRSVGGRGGGS